MSVILTSAHKEEQSYKFIFRLKFCCFTQICLRESKAKASFIVEPCKHLAVLFFTRHFITSSQPSLTGVAKEQRGVISEYVEDSLRKTFCEFEEMMSKLLTKPCKPVPTHIGSPIISHEGLTKSAGEDIKLLSLGAQMTTADLPTQPTDTQAHCGHFPIWIIQSRHPS